MKRSLRSGWGQNSWTSVHYSPLNPTESFLGWAESSSNTGLAVGLGRSYGDSSLNRHGTTWTTENLKQIEIFPEHRYAFCESGVTIGEIERAASKYALFPPVVPGTEFVTVGGAIASNVHGKSHHSDGSFGDNVLELTLLNSRGEQKVLKPKGENADQFWATVGGMGLTGAIINAKIKLKPVETNYLLVEEVRVRNLTEMLSQLEYFDSKYSHTVAWIDLSGSYHGRGIVGGGNFAPLSEITSGISPFSEKYPLTLSLPKKLPFSIINNSTVRIFNTFWYLKPTKKGLMHFQPFLHPLDSLRNWNSVYGRLGFLQYQFVIPFGKEGLIFDFITLMRSHRVTSFLTVLKRLHTKNSRFLSFPINGWTLAVDFSAKRKSFISALNEFDEKIIEVGGRIYLTKDSRMSKQIFQRMYPQVHEWKTIKRSLDPDDYWESEQGRRLGLC